MTGPDPSRTPDEAADSQASGSGDPTMSPAAPPAPRDDVVTAELDGWGFTLAELQPEVLGTPRPTRPARRSVAPELPVVRPIGFRFGVLDALRSVPPRRRAKVMALLLAAGALLFITVRQGFGSGNVPWSARANLLATADEVIKLPTLRLPLEDASAADLTQAHLARAAARARGAEQAEPRFVESVRYVGPRTESTDGTVSVFAGRGVWTAAAREPDGTCLWVMISSTAWGRLYQAGDTPSCTAADVVTGSARLLAAEAAHPIR